MRDVEYNMFFKHPETDNQRGTMRSILDQLLENCVIDDIDADVETVEVCPTGEFRRQARTGKKIITIVVWDKSMSDFGED